ncbi:MAG: amino acid-binding protein [Verrucomicrobia bacterium]|nr:amino acid-binding protein [Verrucomicrobiota bacterium]
MKFKVEKADVWMGMAEDKPGSLGGILARLSKAGARLEFIFARPAGKGKAVFFIAPLKGAAVLKAARSLGVKKINTFASLRFRGPDRAGLGAKIACAMGSQGINICGLSGMGIANQCLGYIAVDNKDVARAQRILKSIL